MLSYSSLEHSGLGRYGDGLNPWADLIAMARAWCVLRPKARVLVGAPAVAEDTIVYNAHRCVIIYSNYSSNCSMIYY